MNKKKFVSILIAFCALCSLMLTSCSQSSEGLAYDENEDHITCTITGIGTCIDTDLIIPENINGLDVIYIDDNAFERCDLTSVLIPETIRSIGEEAFQSCSSLKTVTIKSELKEIKEYTFEDCESLTKIIIPDSVTEIGSYSFANCTNLESITLPDSLTRILGSAFEGCESLSKITIPDGTTDIYHNSFKDCASLTSVTIPDSVTKIMGGAFKGCWNLKKIIFKGTIAEWNTIDLDYLSYYEDELGNGPWLISEDWIDLYNSVEIVCEDGRFYINQ